MAIQCNRVECLCLNAVCESNQIMAVLQKTYEKIKSSTDFIFKLTNNWKKNMQEIRAHKYPDACYIWVCPSIKKKLNDFEVAVYGCVVNWRDVVAMFPSSVIHIRPVLDQKLNYIWIDTKNILNKQTNKWLITNPYQGARDCRLHGGVSSRKNHVGWPGGPKIK